VVLLRRPAIIPSVLKKVIKIYYIHDKTVENSVPSTYTTILQFLLSLMNNCACTSAALVPSAEAGVVARVLARKASAVSKMDSSTRWVMTNAPGGSKLLMVD